MVFSSPAQLLLIWRYISFLQNICGTNVPCGCLRPSSLLSVFVSLFIGHQGAQVPIWQCAYSGLVKREIAGISCSFSSIHLWAWDAMEEEHPRMVLCASLLSQSESSWSQVWSLNCQETSRQREQSGCKYHITGGWRIDLQNFSLGGSVWKSSFSDFPEQFQFHAT